MYYVSYCPYCREAIDYIKRNRLRYTLVNVDDYDGKDNVFNVLKNNSDMKKSHNTVPAIFYNGKFVGGCAELKRKF